MLHSETSLAFVLEIPEASGRVVSATSIWLRRETGTFAFSNPWFISCQITVPGAVVSNPLKFQLRCPDSKIVVLVGRLNLWEPGPIGYGTVIKLPVGSLRIDNIWANGITTPS